MSLGGQTAINLAEPLAELGVPIIGTDCAAIRNAEDRDCFEKIMEELGIPQPEAEAVTDIEAGVRGRRAYRLSGAGASELRAGRPRHADRLERGAAAPLPSDGRAR